MLNVSPTILAVATRYYRIHEVYYKGTVLARSQRKFQVPGTRSTFFWHYANIILCNSIGNWLIAIKCSRDSFSAIALLGLGYMLCLDQPK